MTPFALTRKAVADLRAIAVYTDRRWGRDRRNLYVRQLDDAFRLLAKNPGVGKPCEDILPGYRKFPQGSHVVFYRDGVDCTVEIVRILHKSMDVSLALGGREAPEPPPPLA